MGDPASGKGAAVLGAALQRKAFPMDKPSVWGQQGWNVQSHALLPAPLAQTRSTQRGTVPPSQLLCPFSLLPLGHPLPLAAAGVHSTCAPQVLPALCWLCTVLQPPLPSFLLFLSVSLSLPLPG